MALYEAYITWLTNNQVTWTLNSRGVTADTARASDPAGAHDALLPPSLPDATLRVCGFDNFVFQATLRIDWIRVYQLPDSINIGCDPEDRPTSAYIDTYSEVYTNPLLTTWVDIDDHTQEQRRRPVLIIPSIPFTVSPSSWVWAFRDS